MVGALVLVEEAGGVVWVEATVWVWAVVAVVVKATAMVWEEVEAEVEVLAEVEGSGAAGDAAPLLHMVV